MVHLRGSETRVSGLENDITIVALLFITRFFFICQRKEKKNRENRKTGVALAPEKVALKLAYASAIETAAGLGASGRVLPSFSPIIHP